MTSKRRGRDWWSEVKLQILSEYLHGFTTAVTDKSDEVLCLDLFAGSYGLARLARRRPSPTGGCGGAR